MAEGRRQKINQWGRRKTREDPLVYFLLPTRPEDHGSGSQAGHRPTDDIKHFVNCRELLIQQGPLTLYTLIWRLTRRLLVDETKGRRGQRKRMNQGALVDIPGLPWKTQY